MALRGLTRDVWITVNDPVFVRRQQIRTEMAGATTVVRNHVFLENTSKRSTHVTIHATVYDSDGNTSATGKQSLAIPPGSKDQVVVLEIAAAKLWDLDHPNI